MIQNMKVEIIYYSIGSDFEMEFNLCGCCRMRLLTDKTETQVEFVKSIARAVKRSKVIFACGPLFSDKGLIATVSKATGIKTTVIDNKEYSIESEDKIEVLDGSTPLVTSDGVFGGCIIENGPQTIIILSQSKSIRKKIMKDLIYPYITKLSLTAAQDSIASFENEIEEETLTQPEQPETVEEQPENKEENDDFEFENEVLESKKAEEPTETVSESEDFNSDFVFFDGKAEKELEKQDESEEFTINTDFDLFISEADKDKNLSFENQNQKYYLVDDHELDNELENKGVFVKIMLVLVLLLALVILYIAVARPLLLRIDITENLKNLLNLNVFNSLNFLLRG